MEEKYNPLDGQANSVSKINGTYSSLRKEPNGSGGEGQLYAMVQKGKPLKPKKTLENGNNATTYACIAETSSSSVPASSERQATGFDSSGDGQMYTEVKKERLPVCSKTLRKVDSEREDANAQTSSSNVTSKSQLEITHGGEGKRRKTKCICTIFVAIVAIAGVCLGVVALLQSTSQDEIKQLAGKINKLEEMLETSTADFNKSIQKCNQLENKTAELEENIIRLHGLFIINGTGYMLTDEAKTWTESRRRCHEQGGDLAAAGIRDSITRSKVGEALLQEFNQAWIGLNDTTTEGQFIWVDGVNSTEENSPWHDNEPNNAAGAEDCVDIKKETLTLYDDPCSSTKRGICEFSWLA